jgi:futalosine hydrolase
VGLTDSEVSQEAPRDYWVVVLAATEAEAEPVRAALLRSETHVVATKKICVGEVEAARPARGLEGAVRKVQVAVAITGCDKANTAHILTYLLEALAPEEGPGYTTEPQADSAGSQPPLLVLQVGIAGALPSVGPGPGAAVGDIVLATQEAYSDTGSSSPEGWLSAAELGLPIANVDGTELGGVFHLDFGLALAATEIVETIDWSNAIEPESAVVSEGVPWPAGVGRPKSLPAVLLGPCVTSSRVTGLLSEAEAVALRWGALAESMEGAAAAHICALYGVPFLEVRGISNLVADRDRSSWQVDRAVTVAGRAALAIMAAIDRLPLSGGEGRGR